MHPLPQLYCPFTPRLNPLTQLANAETVRWARRFRLISSDDIEAQLASERYTWLVGRFFPEAQEQTLQLIADFTSWLFWHDDVCDETSLGEDPEALAATFERLFGILSGHSRAETGHCFEQALAEMRDRLLRLAPDAAWMLRFLTSTREYFDACVWESTNRSEGVTPSIGRFVPLRRCSGGMWIYKDFVELVIGRSLPLELRQHRDVQRLIQITQNVACWHNDIFSLEKEMRRGDVHNLVTTIQAEQGLELHEALQCAASYADAEVHAFLALRGKMRSFGPTLDAILQPYIRGLEALMQGNLDWSLESARYSPAGDAADEPPRSSILRDLKVPSGLDEASSG